MDRRSFLVAGLGLAGGARSGRAAPAAIEKVKDLVVYSSPNHYCGPGPGVVRLPGGELVLAFRRSPFNEWAHGHPDVEACLVRSRDQGATWSEPQVFDSGAITNQNLTLTTDNTLVCASHGMQLVSERVYRAVLARPETASDASRLTVRVQTAAGAEEKPTATGYYAVEQGTYLRRSTDSGRTWSQRYWIDIPEIPAALPGLSSALYLRGPVVELREGELALAVYTNELRNGQPARRSLLVLSHDGGRTWTLAGTIAVSAPPVGFDETEVYECPSGKLVAFMRVSHPDRGEMKLYTASSRDVGRTWSRPQRREVWGHPFHPLRMASGRVLLTYGYRREPFGIRARLLDPECDEIDGAREVVLRDDGQHTDLGYPSATLLPSGEALVTYYMNTRADQGQARFIGGTIVRES